MFLWLPGLVAVIVLEVAWHRQTGGLFWPKAVSEAITGLMAKRHLQEKVDLGANQAQTRYVGLALRAD